MADTPHMRLIASNDKTPHARTRIIFDAVVARLLALGHAKATVAARATFMINRWEYFSENSVDERGHETCRDWMDAELVELLDQALRARYGLAN
jgi:hypothetical protein